MLQHLNKYLHILLKKVMDNNKNKLRPSQNHKGVGTQKKSS